MSSSKNKNIGHKLNRGFLNIAVGDFVKNENEIYKIAYLLGLDQVIAINVENAISRKFATSELDSIDPNDDNLNMHRDLSDFTDKEWRIINKRLKAIRPLLANGTTQEDVEKQAKKAMVSIPTIYRWRQLYERTNSIIGLLPSKSGINSGTIKIDSKLERIIQDVIENHITPQRLPVSSIVELVEQRCFHENIESPSESTIRRRVNALSLYKQYKKRGMKSHVNTHLMPRPGTYEASYPLEIIQIDHTPADIIIVNDDREVIGRPWITLAIDLYSRVVVGFHLSLDAPSTTSVALCLAQAINPKEQWLADRDIDAKWPIWGRMKTIHADNGADFRGDSLRRSCEALEMNLVWRAIGKTHWGGHIERMLGTVLRRLHTIPGTTFSNIKSRFEYDSESNAIMTFEELEQYIGVFITKYYHNQKHGTLGITPLKKLELGMLNSESPGYQPRPKDPQTILLDLLPSFERYVSNTGVHISGISYYDDVLRPYISLHKHINNIKTKQLFKRDPRDITYIWFYEKNTRSYFKIPTATPYASLNLWELRAAKKHMKAHNTKFDEILVLNALDEMSNILNKSQVATKKAKRKVQKKKEDKKSLGQYIDTPPSTSDDGWDDDAFN